MMGLSRRRGAAVAVLALWAVGPAAAQENLEKGKTPAQLYASDCAICHKSPRGLAKGVRRYGLDNFLREHYTASRESAAAISAYLQAIDRGAPAPQGENTTKRKVKASKPALPPGKPAEAKSSDTKASETKPAEAKPPEAKVEAPQARPEEKPASDAKPAGSD
jgi:hypothetical protein